MSVAYEFLRLARGSALIPLSLLLVFGLSQKAEGAPVGQSTGQSTSQTRELSTSIGDTPPSSLNFHQALDRALSLSPDYDTLVRTDRMSKLSTRNAWSALLPEADLQLSHQYADQGGSLPPTAYVYPHAPWSNFAALNVNENLYDNGDSWRAYQVAELNGQIGNLSLQRGRQALLLKVAKVYYDFSSANAAIELQKQEIETLRVQFRTIEGRYRQGMSSNRDYLRIKVQLQRAEVSLATQSVSIEDERANLRLAVGEKTAVDFIPFVQLPNRLEALAFPDVSEDQTFDFRIARLQDEISMLKYRTVLRASLPRLSLKASYEYSVPEYLGQKIPGVDDPYWNFTGMIVVDYALFDWGIRGRNVEIADNQKQIEMDSQKTIRLTTGQSLVRLKAQADLLLKSYRESLLILKNEEESYDSLNRGYREGKVTYLDLITGLNDLYSARTQNQDLQYRLLKARADVAYYEGNLDEVLQKQ